MKQRRKRIIISVVLLLMAGVVLVYIFSPFRTKTVDLGNSYVGTLEAGIKEVIMIPINMEERGNIHFYKESGGLGRISLEKKEGNNWKEVVSAPTSNGAFGIREYVDKGLYRIRVRALTDCKYVEFATEYFDELSNSFEDAKLITASDVANNMFTSSETKSHWYTFHVAEPSIGTAISLSSGWGDDELKVRIKVYDRHRNLLAQEETSAEGESEVMIQKNLSRGDYYIEITKVNKRESGNYSFYFYFAEDQEVPQ